MRIFIVSPKLSYGGAERVGCMLAEEFAFNGHDVTIIGCSSDNNEYTLNKNVRILYLQSSYNKYTKWLKHVISLRRTIRKYSPDVVIGIMWSCSLIAWISCLGKNIPVVSTVHDSFERPKSAPMSRMEHFIKFKLNKIYRCVTVLTHADKQVIGNHLKNVYVMPNPLALQPVKECPLKENIILAAGRLEDWHCKGFDILVKAWANIAVKYPDWMLEIAGVGTDSQIAFINKIAEEHGVRDRIKLLGFRTDIIDLYKHSAIFVLSSRYEGFGLVLIEAMSQGCACIAADYKGRQREIIRDDMEGLVCEPDNVCDLSCKLENLLSDDLYRKVLQKNAIEASKRFGIDAIIEKWENLLNNNK